MLHQAVTYLLIGLLVLALGLVLQKGITFIRIARQRKLGNLAGGLNLADPLAAVKLKMSQGELRPDVLRAHAASAASRLEARMSWLAVISSSAPFIGLAGTVWGVMQALTTLTGTDLNVGALTGPLSEALAATLWGLAAAIPATIAYSLMTGHVARLQEEAFLYLDMDEGVKVVIPESGEATK
jgi:hypothetical protein